MDAYKTKVKATNGTVTIQVPGEFDNKMLEVIILSSQDATVDFDKKNSQKDRLMKIVGAAKFPEYPIDKYDVYDQ